MAVFNIEFEMKELEGPTYEDYSVGVQTICDDDAQPREVIFDDPDNGDFVVGFNYYSPDSLPPGSVIFKSFTDITREYDNVTGIITVIPLTPNELRDNSTGSNLVYPYITPVGNLNNIVQFYNQIELTCNTDSVRYTRQRDRVITFSITDSLGTEGPDRIATFRNTQQ